MIDVLQYGDKWIVVTYVGIAATTDDGKTLLEFDSGEAADSYAEGLTTQFIPD